MKEGGIGGEKTVTGINFESKVDFLKQIERMPGYTIQKSLVAGTDILFQNVVCATCYRKHQFYKFLKSRGVNWRSRISRKLLPDDAIFVINRETVFIVEVKFQQVEGSVDEKLQTCDFKRKQYLKLVSPMNLKVEYVYVLNNWFKQDKYKDVLDYIQSVNCHYRFNELPFAWLGLPNFD